MNWHFLFFILDIVGWIGIALSFNYLSIVLTYKVSTFNILKINTIIIALSAGSFSVIIYGIPNIGLSLESFMYAFFACLIFILFQQITKEKVKIKKVIVSV